MHRSKKQYAQLVFKCLLLAVYFVFFSVQLLLRYTSDHSQQSLDFERYQKRFNKKTIAGNAISSKDEIRKSRPFTYLNKRFHPKDYVIPNLAVGLQQLCLLSSVNYYLINKRVPKSKINTSCFRGPPCIC
jgi:hypothetical protein